LQATNVCSWPVCFLCISGVAAEHDGQDSRDGCRAQQHRRRGDADRVPESRQHSRPSDWLPCSIAPGHTAEVAARAAATARNSHE